MGTTDWYNISIIITVKNKQEEKNIYIRCIYIGIYIHMRYWINNIWSFIIYLKIVIWVLTERIKKDCYGHKELLW